MVEGDEAAFIETNTNAAVPRLLERLEASGLTPEQVRYVIITHVHLDHAGGAGLLMQACPNATLLAHPRAAPHVIDPRRIIAGATAVYGPERFAELYGEIVPVAEDRVRAMADGETLQFGQRTLSFLHTPGHANHHFCVHDSRENGVFTGDSFGILYPALQKAGLFVFPSSTPTDFDAAAAHVAVDRIVGTGAEVAWPTHFGPTSQLAEIASELHRQLDDYAALVDEADASGRTDNALDAFCGERVRAFFAAELAQHGLDGDADLEKTIAIDVELNGQGVAFAVKKRRFKRSRR
ncbi:MAG: MBL fold metallo-hydrolase [Proteobacteria bacterium]|nr:MBL fold metallo-hydrolase [Pseudomonadota bacterium]